MGFPLQTVIAGILMVELERRLLPMLHSYMTSWKCYLNDTIAYVETDAMENALSILTSFHGSIPFTYEKKNIGKVSFIDILILRNGNSFETTVQRKSTHNDIYLHWKSFAPNAWKRGTHRKLV